MVRTLPFAIKLGMLAALAAAALFVGITHIGPAPQSAEAGAGPAISLRVDVTQQISCGSPAPGKVCVSLGQKFDVIVVADAIPAAGYVYAGAWIDYDAQGLVHKNNTVALWPDCDGLTLLPSQDVANNAASAGCLTGLLPPLPVSSHVGDLYSFSLTCTSFISSSTIQLLPEGDPIAGTSGTAFTDANGVLVVPALTGITVSCAAAGPHKLPHPGDTDGDGCSDWQENVTDETLGGQRNWKNAWDFYDVLGPGMALPKDKFIDLPNDILGVIQHFSPQGQPPYDVNFDRGPKLGPNPWNMTAPDGVIDLPNDILGVILQHGHSCQ